MLEGRNTSLLAPAAKVCGMTYWLASKACQPHQAFGPDEMVNADAVTRMVLAGEPFSYAVARRNILETPYPVHYPLPADSVGEYLEAALAYLSRSVSADLRRFVSLLSAICPPTQRLYAIKNWKESTTLSERTSPLYHSLSELIYKRGRASCGAPPPPGKHVLKCAKFEDLCEVSAGYAEASAARRDNIFGRGFGCLRSVVDKVLQRLAPDLAQNGLELAGLARQACRRVVEQILVHGMCGSVTSGRLREGTSLQRPFSVGPSQARGGGTHLSRKLGCVNSLCSPFVRSVSADSLGPIANRITSADVLAGLQKRGASIRLRSQLLGKFPRKAHPTAGKKCNIFLDSLLTDLYSWRPAVAGKVGKLLSTLPSGIYYEDQICNALLHAFSVDASSKGIRLFAFILIGLREPEILKSLSDIIKSTGSNTQLAWAQLAELHCLLGRNIGSGKLLEDAQRRVGNEPYWEVPLDSVRLKAVVTEILSEELGGKLLHVDDVERHWQRRLEWCVAGSHSHTTNHDVCFSAVPRLGPGGTRVTRRMAMEYTRDNPLLSWDGLTKVSVIEKLEQGKTRAIYSCNTANYVAFSRVLRPAERAWRGRRVIVDPGAGGNYGMFRRIREAWPGTLPVALMLDYADFNSQHTLESQQIVMEALLERCLGVEQHEKDVLIGSFKRMELYHEGVYLGKVRRSLMSGHRGTSFINSVLNAAYLRLAIGAERYNHVQSFHVGDDVLIFCRSASEAYQILQDMESVGFRLQSTKQSVGAAGFEFLRMAGTRHQAQGYLARAVSSCVSGNWTSDWQMSPAAALHSLIQMARSIINRSTNVDAWQLMLSSCASVTNLPREILCEVLSGQVAVGSGPVYRSDGRHESREIMEIPDQAYARLSSLNERELPRWATRDYFEDGCCALEHKAMEVAGFAPWGAALRSTYGDLATLADSQLEDGLAANVEPVSLGARTLFMKSGETVLDRELDRPVQRGVLAQFPVIAFLQHVLTDEQLGELLRAGGYQFEPGSERITAFGGVREGATVRGWLPYSDAASLGTRAIPQAVRVMYPLYM